MLLEEKLMSRTHSPSLLTTHMARNIFFFAHFMTSRSGIRSLPQTSERTGVTSRLSPGPLAHSLACLIDHCTVDFGPKPQNSPMTTQTRESADHQTPTLSIGGGGSGEWSIEGTMFGAVLFTIYILFPSRSMRKEFKARPLVIVDFLVGAKQMTRFVLPMYLSTRQQQV